MPKPTVTRGLALVNSTHHFVSDKINHCFVQTVQQAEYNTLNNNSCESITVGTIPLHIQYSHFNLKNKLKSKRSPTQRRRVNLIKSNE